MIGPRMATMLAFLLTDARVGRRRPPARSSPTPSKTSFNCISVEGHTSTNDTVLLLASGAAGEPAAPRRRPRRRSPRWSATACESLARMIPDDGEGATHLITIDVEGCRDRERGPRRSPGPSPTARS